MSGISWPWTSSPAWISNEKSINNGLMAVVKTRNGERKLNWIWGSQVIQLVFENEGRALEVMANREIALTYSKLFPSIKILSIDYKYHKETYKPTEIFVKYEYLGEIEETSIPIDQE